MCLHSIVDALHVLVVRNFRFGMQNQFPRTTQDIRNGSNIPMQKPIEMASNSISACTDAYYCSIGSVAVTRASYDKNVNHFNWLYHLGMYGKFNKLRAQCWHHYTRLTCALETHTHTHTKSIHSIQMHRNTFHTYWYEHQAKYANSLHCWNQRFISIRLIQ